MAWDTVANPGMCLDLRGTVRYDTETRTDTADFTMAWNTVANAGNFPNPGSCTTAVGKQNTGAKQRNMEALLTP